MDDKTQKSFQSLLTKNLQKVRKDIKQDTKSQIDQGFKDVRENLEQDMIRVFSQGFEEVVVPELEEIRGDIRKIDVRLERVENKLDVLADKDSDHEIRIKRLEKNSPRVLAA